MSKSVIVLTISTALWLISGSVLAQGNRPSARPIANGLLMNVPAIAPLDRPAIVHVAHAAKIPEVATSMGGAAQGIADGKPGHAGLTKAAKHAAAVAQEKSESVAAASAPSRVLPTCR